MDWFETSVSDRMSHVQRLVGYLDLANDRVRRKSTRSLLYLLQGNFGDCNDLEEQVYWARSNVYLCIEAGLLQVIINLLLYEIEHR